MERGPTHRLAVYGSLAPGGPNHERLSDRPGRWIQGTVLGHLHEEGWGAALGFPAIVLDRDGPEVTFLPRRGVSVARLWRKC